MWEITYTQAGATGCWNWWRFAAQPFRALMERWRILGHRRGAPADRLAFEYYGGKIDTIVDNGDGTCDVECVNDDGSAPGWYYNATGPVKRWVGWDRTDSHGPIFAAANYDLFVDDVPYDPAYPCRDPDPRKVVQRPIVDQYNDHKIKVAIDIPAMIDERRITAVGDLVGRPAIIIVAGGEFWTRFLPDWPNDRHDAYGKVGTSAAGTLTPKLFRKRPGAPASLVGWDVVYVAGGRMRRGRITAHAAGTNVLTYTGTAVAAVVDADFYVVKPDGYWQWGRVGGKLQSAYGGGRDAGWYSHHPTSDLPVPKTKPAARTPPYTYSQDPLTCPAFPSTDPLFDRDAWNPYDNMCEIGDYPFSPDVNKTFRMAWLNAFGMTGDFVNWHTAFDAVAAATGTLPHLTVAKVFELMGENTYTGTTGTHSGGTLPLVAAVPYTDIPLWWTVKDPDGVTIADGYEPHYNGATVTGAGFGVAHDGAAFVVTPGPTQPLPRQFRTLADVRWFMPAIVSPGGGAPAAPVLPPTDADPGVFNVRAKSAACLSADDLLFVVEGGHARDAFATDMRARYVGDRFSDPGGAQLLAKPTGVGAPDPDPAAEFINNASITRRRAAVFHRLRRAYSGKATGGSNVRLVDSTRTGVADRDWEKVDFFTRDNYTGKTHAGVGGGAGTTTKLVDATKAGTGLWAAARFGAGYGSPFEGFAVRFLISGTSFGDPAAVVEWRQVTVGNGVTGTLQFAEALPVSTAGLQYEMPERFVPNHMSTKGASVRLTRVVDGVMTNEVTRPILGHSPDSLFVADAGFAIDKYTDYEIIVPQLGDVMTRQAGGTWLTTGGAGADPRVVGAVFRRDGRRNCEDHDTRYGLPGPMVHTMQFAVGHRQLQKYFDELLRVENSTYDFVKACSVAGGDSVPVDWNQKHANWHPIGTTPAGEPATFNDVYSKLTNGNYPTEVIPTFWNNGENDPPGAPPNDLPPGDRNCTHGMPEAVFLGASFWQWLPPTPSWVANYMGPALARRQRDQMAFTYPTSVAKTVHFLVRTLAPAIVDTTDYDHAAPGSGVEYDANGDHVYQEAWAEFGSTGPTTSNLITSPTLGGTAMPAESTVPTPTGSGTSIGQPAKTTRIRGWVAAQITSVAEYDLKYRQGGCGGTTPLPDPFEWIDF